MHPKQREGSFGEKSKWAMNEHPILVTSNEKERNPFISLLLRPPTHTLAMREREKYKSLHSLFAAPWRVPEKHILNDDRGRSGEKSKWADKWVPNIEDHQSEGEIPSYFVGSSAQKKPPPQKRPK